MKLGRMDKLKIRRERITDLFNDNQNKSVTLGALHHVPSNGLGSVCLMDHKPNFQKNPTTRLLNPTKTEIGRIAKQKLANVVTNVNIKLPELQLWKNTD